MRVIAATNKDLEEEIARGNFREDLFYRLNVIPFFVPPLRDRKEDIPLLVKEFLQEFGQQYGRPHVEMHPDALDALRQYHWPGNVRELRNLVERVLILNPKTQRIERKHLPLLVSREAARDGAKSASRSEEFSTLLEAREAYERDYILKKLDECDGNVTRAAEALGLERSHLYRKMKALGVNVNRLLRQHEITLQNGFAIVYSEGRSVAAFQMPQAAGAPVEAKPWLPDTTPEEEDSGPAANLSGHRPGDTVPIGGPTDTAILTLAQRSDQPVFSLGDKDFALGAAALKQGGTVVVGLPMPYGIAAAMTRLHNATDLYWSVYRSRRQVRNLYMMLLLLMTTLALFACSWLALNLSKQVTKPVEALADAMQAIAAGDYAHRVAESSTEELGDLVRSFNRMAGELEDSRHAVESSTLQLSAANATLEARSSELETMLETIPNGVATLDTSRRIVLTNRALTEMLDPGGQTPFIGSSIDTIFPAEAMETLDHLLQRSHRMGSASGEMEMTLAGNGAQSGGTMVLLATVALLETGSGPERIHHGYVLVLENATELLRAQKQSAWREVARRVAHEIKNPLTPISLSAEQIHRHIDRLGATLDTAQLESPSIAVIRRSSEVISSAVDSMRSLVNQFSSLAQFPTAEPRPADLNPIVENSLALFAGRLQAIRLIQHLAPNLPLVLADPEATKRALGNLIDNAAEAMQHSLLRELRITTALLPSGMVELTVSDTGPGLTDEMRERLFLPYFSTKQRGTGLGLAIAAKIIQEQQGTIRAEKNHPAGARFIIELRPAATDSDSAPETSTVDTVTNSS